MKRLFTATTLALSLVAGSAYAEPTKQKKKMAACNMEARNKKGDERKDFMRMCLGDRNAKQQDKIKDCVAAAKHRKGDERKAFMNDCLTH